MDALARIHEAAARDESEFTYGAPVWLGRQTEPQKATTNRQSAGYVIRVPAGTSMQTKKIGSAEAWAAHVTKAGIVVRLRKPPKGQQRVSFDFSGYHCRVPARLLLLVSDTVSPPRTKRSPMRHSNGGIVSSLHFGKHRGVPLDQVPVDYLQWLWVNVTKLAGNVRAAIRHELDRRFGLPAEPTCRESSEPPLMNHGFQPVVETVKAPDSDTPLEAMCISDDLRKSLAELPIGTCQEAGRVALGVIHKGRLTEDQMAELESAVEQWINQ